MTDLPDGWEWSTLGEVMGAGLFADGDWVETKDQDPSGQVRLLQLADVGEGLFRDRSSRFMTNDAAVRLRCTDVLAGDILVARMPEPIGRACLAPLLGQRAVTAVDVCILRPRSTGAVPHWLMWALNTPQVRSQVSALQSGTTRKRISRKNLGTVRLPVPPRAEQERIVAAIEEHLSRLDAAQAQLDATGLRLALLRGQVLEDAFIGMTVREPVGEVAEVRGGIQKQPKRRPNLRPAPFLRVANVQRGRLDLSEVHEIELFEGDEQRYGLEAGDLLVVEGNGSPDQIGRSALWTNEMEGCVHQNHLIRVRPGPRLDARFLDLFWNAPSTARQLAEVASSTSGLYTLSTAKVKRVEVPVPALTTQVRTAEALIARLAAIDRLIGQVVVAQRRIASLRRSILAAAFAGKLVPQDPGDEPAAVLLERIRSERG